MFIWATVEVNLAIVAGRIYLTPGPHFCRLSYSHIANDSSRIISNDARCCHTLVQEAHCQVTSLLYE